MRARGRTSGSSTSRRGSDLRQLSPVQIDERWAAVLEPVNRALMAAGESERLIRRYRKAGPVPAYLTERLAGQQAAVAAAREAELPFQAEYQRRGRWSRYFLVANSDGHLHRAGCSTLHPGRTRVMPVFELSGANAEEVVARMGYTACTVCFPNAPVARAPTLADAGYCPGSNIVPDDIDWSRRYARCPHCGQSVALTNRGLRKHKPRHTRTPMSEASS